MFKGEQDVWRAARQMKRGCIVDVAYFSKRADRILHMEGEVTSLKARPDRCRFIFFREDGQPVEVREDGGIYSIGSNYPHNGYIRGIEITENPLVVEDGEFSP